MINIYKKESKYLFVKIFIALAALYVGGVNAQSLPIVESAARNGAVVYSVPVQTLLAITGLTLLPAALSLLTSFTRIIIALSILRQALGLQTTPPNVVLIGLSIFLTVFIMRPTIEDINKTAYTPLVAGEIQFEEAVTRAQVPLRKFMLANTGKNELDTFIKISGEKVDNAQEVPMTILIPAFAISEIKAGFMIGFLLFLPFLAIDIAVASILTSLGMVMVSPMMFSLPIKLIIFVLADGWTLLSGSLVGSFLIN